MCNQNVFEISYNILNYEIYINYNPKKENSIMYTSLDTIRMRKHFVKHDKLQVSMRISAEFAWEAFRKTVFLHDGVYFLRS